MTSTDSARLSSLREHFLLLLPSFLIPYHSQPIIDALIDFIEVCQPDEIVQFGQLISQRWTRLYERTPEKITGCAAQVNRVLVNPIRKVYSGPITLMLDRETSPTFLRQLLRELDGRALVRATGAETDVEMPWHLEDASDVSHEDLGVPGNHAMQVAKRIGKPTVLTGTNRVGLAVFTVEHGQPEKNRSVAGLEIGTLADIRRARLHGHRTSGWQNGFAIAEIDEGTVSFELQTIGSLLG